MFLSLIALPHGDQTKASIKDSNVPHIILLLYLAGLLALGIVSLLKSRKAAHAEAGYYLASRGQGVLTTSLTIMATYFSGFAILAFPGRVYGNGIPPKTLRIHKLVAQERGTSG